MPVIQPGRTVAEFADFVSAMAAMNPNGFREVPKRGRNNTLLYTALVAAGVVEPDRGPASERGARRRAARARAREILRRMREAYPMTDGMPPRHWHSGAKRGHSLRVRYAGDTPVDFSAGHSRETLAAA